MKRRLAIIGGGPAGLAAALEGAKQGLAVTLFERGRIGEYISCAEGLFDPTGSVGEPQVGVRYKVRSLVIGCQEEYEFDTTDVPLWMLDRKVWQRHLAGQARSAGVEIKENEPVSRRNFTWLKGEFDWIIDASGVPPVTALVYGFRDFYYPHSLVAAQYVLAGDFRHLPQTFKIGLERDCLGYYWIFPQDENTANVGVALLPEDIAPREISSLWHRLGGIMTRENLTGVRILERNGGLCPAKILPRLVWDNVVIAGDAAGFTSPLHGGGIDLAMVSGREAVRALATDVPEAYRENMLKIMGKRLEIEEDLARIWAEASGEQVDRVLAGARDFLDSKGDTLRLPQWADLLKKGYRFFQYWEGIKNGFKGF